MNWELLMDWGMNVNPVKIKRNLISQLVFMVGFVLFAVGAIRHLQLLANVNHIHQ
jgi:hypothetical protein